MTSNVAIPKAKVEDDGENAKDFMGVAGELGGYGQGEQAALVLMQASVPACLSLVRLHCHNGAGRVTMSQSHCKGQTNKTPN